MDELGSRSSGESFDRGVAWLPWLAAWIACLPLVLGFPMGHDWTFELVRVAEYGHALAAGQLPPYWGENLYAGYGSPVFLFYAPLFCALAVALGGFAGHPVVGATAALAALTFASVWLARRMLEAMLEWASGGASGGAEGSGAHSDSLAAAARLGASFYVLHPYLLGDKFLRNASAEFAALSLVPCMLYGVFRMRRAPRAGFAWLSAGFALTILSHNLTALVAGALVLGAWLATGPRNASRREWAWLVAALVLALGLTLFFWLPALSLTSLVRPEDLLRGKFDFRRNFPPLSALFALSAFYAAGPATAGALVAMLFAALARLRGAITGRGRWLPLLVATGSGAGLLLFLMHPISTAVWERVPFLPLFQFPWRLVGPLALLCSIGFALVVVLGFERLAPARRRSAEVVLWILCVANALPVLARVVAVPEAARAELPSVLSAASIRNGTQSVSVLDEYLPRGADPTAWRNERPGIGAVVAPPEDVAIDVVQDRGSRIRLRTQADRERELRFARWYFPGWRAELSGQPARVRRNSAGGLSLRVPAGEAEVALALEPPAVRRVGGWISALLLPVWIALASGRPARLWAPSST